VSAGNDGPYQSTVQGDAYGPWVTAVASSTLPRKFLASLMLGNGVALPGASLTATPLGPKALVYAGDAPAAGANTYDASLCMKGTLDPAVVAGKIVVSSLAVLVFRAACCERCGFVTCPELGCRLHSLLLWCGA